MRDRHRLIMTSKKKTADALNEAALPASPVFLFAASREELAAEIEKFASQLPKGSTMHTGAIGRSADDGQYSVRIDY